MNFAFKLQAGFFKTRGYLLTIEEDMIVLAPEDGSEEGAQVIEKDELKSFSIITGNSGAGEVEIVTRDNIYIGSFFSTNADMDELFRDLAQGLGDKFIFRHGNI